MNHRPARPSVPAVGRNRRRLLGAVVPALMLATLVATPASAGSAGSAASAASAGTLGTGWAAAPAQAECTDQQVTVVVDSTELGGEIAVGCSDVPATGTEALLAAGFQEVRDPSGFICAINGLPDPCPTEFTGSFWSYWYGEPGGDWQTYEEGSDTSATVAGQSEGWRWGDGSQGPDVTPTAVPATASATAPASDSATAPATDPPTESADDVPLVQETPTVAANDSGPSSTALAGIGLVVLLAVAGVIIAARRRSATARTDGSPRQD